MGVLTSGVMIVGVETDGLTIDDLNQEHEQYKAYLKSCMYESDGNGEIVNFDWMEYFDHVMTSCITKSHLWCSSAGWYDNTTFIGFELAEDEDVRGALFADDFREKVKEIIDVLKSLFVNDIIKVMVMPKQI